MRVSTASCSTKGLFKKINQDNILLTHNKLNNTWLAVVCDGVGGLDCGEIASSFVVEELLQWFKHLTNHKMNFFKKNYRAILEELSKDINVKLYEMGRKEDKTLGTTLTALLIIDKYYYLLHIGDTRVYFINQDTILQLTKDHTQYELYLERGSSDIAEMKNKNILWQCVGVGKSVAPQILCDCLLKGTFLLCSDGFRDEVSEVELWNKIACAKMRTPSKLKQILEELIELNIARNEKDNISAILIDISLE